MTDFTKDYQSLNDENHVFKEINYDELIDLLDGFSSGFVYIGGPWDSLCQRVVPIVNDLAKKYGIETVYSFDTKFKNAFNETDDLRDCSSLENKMNYYYLVEKIKYKSPELVKNTLISKMPVPIFLGIKHGTCIGYYSPDEASIVSDNNRLHKNIKILMDEVKEKHIF